MVPQTLQSGLNSEWSFYAFPILTALAVLCWMTWMQAKYHCRQTSPQHIALKHRNLCDFLLRAQGLDPNHPRKKKPRDPWRYYNERWNAVQDYIDDRYSGDDAYDLQLRHGVSFFETYQPAFAYTAIPWPVPSTRYEDVDVDAVRGFYARSPLSITHTSRRAEKLEVLRAQFFCLRERERWWAFVAYLEEFEGREYQEAVDRLVMVLEVLGQVWGDVEDRALGMVASGASV